MATGWLLVLVEEVVVVGGGDGSLESGWELGCCSGLVASATFFLVFEGEVKVLVFINDTEAGSDEMKCSVVLIRCGMVLLMRL